MLKGTPVAELISITSFSLGSVFPFAARTNVLTLIPVMSLIF
ncbi:hypothetical protein VCHC46B1_1487 [Vibrio cholerae HC-46B1]|nr:hypothetical protein VCHC46B1_2429 [Vibrio cholerae HC-46B1]EKL96549.1 hypothetical protein VCHC46B1_1487 [Vibrio cholerae HC-46B1]